MRLNGLIFTADLARSLFLNRPIELPSLLLLWLDMMAVIVVVVVIVSNLVVDI
jgi:hypothetical protein